MTSTLIEEPLPELKLAVDQTEIPKPWVLRDTIAAREALHWLGNHVVAGSIIAFDVETGGLQAHKAPLRLIQLYLPGTGRVLIIDVESIDAADGPSTWESAFIRLVDRVCGTSGAYFTAHNAQFDWGFIEHRMQHVADDVPDVRDWRKEVHWSPVNVGARYTAKTLDTLIASRLVNTHSGVGHKLKQIAKRMNLLTKADLTAKSMHVDMRKNKWDWSTIPTDNVNYLFYAAMDVVIQSEVCRQLFMESQRFPWDVYWFEARVALLFTDIERSGVRVNSERATELLAENYDEEARIRFWLLDQHGLKNPNSPAQLQAALAKEGVETTELTDTGKPKLDKAVLESFRTESVVADHVLRLRHLQTQQKWLKPLALCNGWIHPSIVSLAAVTGRSSVTNPPLQQLPKEGSEIRSLLRARKTDHSVVSIDYSQIEIRVLAVLSGDETMRQMFRDGVDLHGETAETLNVSRRLAKGVNFGVIYGGGPSALAKTVGCTEAEAQQVVMGWKTLFPKAAAWMAQLMDAARMSETVQLYDGRRIHVPRYEAYKAINYVVQGSAAALFKEGVLAVADVGLASNIMFPVHDELVFSFPSDCADGLAEMAKGAMESLSIRTVVPVVCDVEFHGDQWGSA